MAESKYTDKELRLLLAPLAVRILETDKEMERKMQLIDGEEFHSMDIVRLYESVLDMLCSAYHALHS